MVTILVAYQLVTNKLRMSIVHCQMLKTSVVDHREGFLDFHLISHGKRLISQTDRDDYFPMLLALSIVRQINT
jgi:hypothetical protein